MADDAFTERTDLRTQIDEQTPLERVAQPDEIAGAAVDLASDAASFMLGEMIKVDGDYEIVLYELPHSEMESTSFSTSRVGRFVTEDVRELDYVFAVLSVLVVVEV